MKKELSDGAYSRISRQKRFTDDDMDKFTKNGVPFINKDEKL